MVYPRRLLSLPQIEHIIRSFVKRCNAVIDSDIENEMFGDRNKRAVHEELLLYLNIIIVYSTYHDMRINVCSLLTRLISFTDSAVVNAKN